MALLVLYKKIHIRFYKASGTVDQEQLLFFEHRDNQENMNSDTFTVNM